MRIEVFGEGIDRSSINKTNHKISCRGVVVHDNAVLAVYFHQSDLFNLPGGGLEKGESLSNCAIREVLEETGYAVTVKAETVTVIEYYPDSTWETHFFRCELKSDKPKDINPTEEEKNAGMEVRWIEMYEFLSILEDYPSKNPHGQNIHQRELIGLINSL